MNDSSELQKSPESYDERPPLASEKAAHQAKLRERLKQVQAAKIAEKQAAKDVAKPRPRQPAIRDTTEQVTPEMMQPRKPTKAQIKAAEKVALYEASQKPPEDKVEDKAEDPSMENDTAMMNDATDDGPVKQKTRKPTKITDKRREYEKVGREILKQRKWEERENALLDRVRELICSEFSGPLSDEVPHDVGHADLGHGDDILLALYDDNYFAKLTQKNKTSTPNKTPRQPAFKSSPLELRDLY